MVRTRFRPGLELLEGRLPPGDLGLTAWSVIPPKRETTPDVQLLQTVSALQNTTARAPTKIGQPCTVPIKHDPISITGGEDEGDGEVVTNGGPIIRTIKASGPAIGSWEVITRHTCTQQRPPAQGYFLLVHVRSFHNMDNRPPGGPNDIHSIRGSLVVTPYVVGIPYSTRQTTRDMQPGPGKFTSEARSIATVTAMAPPNYTWTGAGTRFGIVVNGPTGVIVGEQALANVNIFDPLTIYDVTVGQTFTVTHNQNGSWSYEFPTFAEAGMNYTASANITGSAGSDVPGFENLFRYNISLTNTGSLNVSFSSNPALGLNDQEMVQAIRDGYTFDAGAGNWIYSGPSISVTFAAPTPGTFTFSTGQEATICAAAGSNGGAMIGSPSHEFRVEPIGGGCGGIGIT